MLKFSCFLTGDDFKIVKHETPPSKKKINLLALCIFVPVIMWFCSTFLLMTNVLEKPFNTSLLAAAIVALLIFLIERSIIMASGSWILFLFRITMGLFVAILGSVALDEVIFKNDIDQKVAEIKRNLLEQENNNIEQSYASQIAGLGKNRDLKYQVWQKALKEAEKEADGTGGSRRRGVSEITKLKLSNSGLLKKDYLEASARFDKSMKDLSSKKQDNTLKIEKDFNENSLLLRVKAMMRLVLEDGFMLSIYIIITALLFCFEFLVVIMKITLPKTTYELKMESIEKIAEQKIKSICKFGINSFQPENNDTRVLQSRHLLNNSSGKVFNHN